MTEEERAESERKWEEEQKDCTHCTPAFDEDKVKDLLMLSQSYVEVRKMYPRWSGTCPVCGFVGIRYASYSHYIYGDW